jgi:ABC-type polysaccharide/polyol phosphate export permease
MIFTVGVATLWTLYGMHHTSSMSIVAFAVTGYSSVLMWRNSVTRSNSAIEQNKSLLFHRNVQVIDVLLTRIALEIGGATCSFLVLSLFFVFIGWMPMPNDLLEVLFGWTMLAWFGATLALALGSAAGFSDLVERLWHPGAYLLFPLSGAAFMVDWLPPTLQKVVLLLPMVHGTEMLRDGWFGAAVPTHYDVSYMATACLVLTLIATYLQRAVRRTVEM